MAIINQAALACLKGDFLKQAGDAIHLYQVLNILLLAQSVQSKLVLAVAYGAFVYHLYFVAAFAEAATKASDYPEEDICRVAHSEIPARL